MAPTTRLPSSAPAWEQLRCRSGQTSTACSPPTRVSSPPAHALPELTYIEASELAYFGAKVLHPKTILPAIEAKIPIRVANTFDPSGASTLIVPDTTDEGSVKAITAIKHLTLVNVEGRGMIGVPGIAARTFKAVAEVGANVLMISQSSSEQSICLAIPESRRPGRYSCPAEGAGTRAFPAFHRPGPGDAQHCHRGRGWRRDARHARHLWPRFHRPGRSTDQRDCPGARVERG